MSLLSVREAFERLVGDARAVTDVEHVSLRQARDRVLASELLALRTQPAFGASAMDGYAVRAADVQPPFRPLRLLGESAAGSGFDGAVQAGEAVRIFTGAPIPDGADAILIQENAERPSADLVLPTEAVRTGRHVRHAGADFSDGDVLLRAGTLLGSGAIALAASGGHPRLEVLRRPRIAVLATGNELVLPGEAVGPAQIVASNSFGVLALVESVGGIGLDFGIAHDSETEIAGFIDRAVTERADVLVTIGGASVGDHDLVGKAFTARGVSLDFWKIAMRPGKPLMAGRLGVMRVLGLPGNPASSMVTATLFLKPLVAALAGRGTPALIERGGVLGADVPANDARAEYMRARLLDGGGGSPKVVPLDRQDSSLLSVFAQADVLLVRPAHAVAGRKGEECRYVPLDR